MTSFEISVRFFLQLAFILFMCRLCGMLFARFGQPQVVGEMIAGVVMGPSIVGALFPAFSAYMFPAETKAVLFTLAQFGLVCYMFIVGMEFDIELIRKRVRSAAAVSAAGIILPFTLGACFAYFIAHDETLFDAKTTTLQAMLFMGAAMSITAFPMLARIILEQGLTKTSLGTLVLAAGSFDDAVAWCVLALVLASFNADFTIALFAIGGGILFAVVTLLVIRRLLVPLGNKVEKQGFMDHGTLAIALMLMALGAWFTDVIEIYAVFGAFIMGVAMPRGKFTDEMVRIMFPITTTMLLPFFFVNSGLNTNIDLVNTPYLWMLTGIALSVAIIGKWVGCYTAARLSGEPNREAMAIGTLMNARGLMELIILNIGLQRGIIEKPLFTIMVIMAIVTTLMATPLFKRIYGSREEREAQAAREAAANRGAA
jgi:Kef-type K+ transport system membrane component KefB